MPIDPVTGKEVVYTNTTTTTQGTQNSTNQNVSVWNNQTYPDTNNYGIKPAPIPFYPEESYVSTPYSYDPGSYASTNPYSSMGWGPSCSSSSYNSSVYVPTLTQEQLAQMTPEDRAIYEEDREAAQEEKEIQRTLSSSKSGDAIETAINEILDIKNKSCFSLKAGQKDIDEAINQIYEPDDTDEEKEIKLAAFKTAYKQATGNNYDYDMKKNQEDKKNSRWNTGTAVTSGLLTAAAACALFPEPIVSKAAAGVCLIAAGVVGVFGLVRNALS